MLEGLKTSPEDINVRDNQTNAPSKRREETVPEGFHVVQKYITDPKLLYGYKTTMSVPVIMTSLEPVRFHIHRDETKVNFACEPYVEEEVWPEVAGKEWMRRHYTKCGEVRKLGDVKLHSMPWAAIDNAVSGILLGGLEDLKEDIKVAREMFMHSGSRPTGSGGTVSESEAKRLAKEHARLSGEWEEENFEKRKEMQVRAERERGASELFRSVDAPNHADRNKLLLFPPLPLLLPPPSLPPPPAPLTLAVAEEQGGGGGERGAVRRSPR